MRNGRSSVKYAHTMHLEELLRMKNEMRDALSLWHGR